jgi:hypothetical protein
MAAGVEMRDIRARMAALPGPELPEKSDALWRWVSQLDLRREDSPAPQPHAAAADTGETDADSAEDDGGAEEMPVAAVADAPRETPQLVRARELLAMAMHPNDIKQAVKLSAIEFGLVLAAHRGAGRAA